MFKIVSNPKFTHTVKVMMPVDGGFEEVSFRAQFKLMNADDMDGYSLGSSEGQEKFLKDIIVGLEDIVGDNGEAIPFNDALRDHIIGILPARNALLETYTAACTKARAGN